MTPAARLSAAIEILDAYLGGAPLEKALTNWARRSRFAGSKDRAAIRDTVFDCVRNRASFSERGGAESGRGLVAAWSFGNNGIDATCALFDGQGHAPDTLSQDELEQLTSNDRLLSETARFDLPEWLIPAFRESYGADAETVAQVLRARAPTFLRFNLRKASRSSAAAKLRSEGVETHDHPSVETALEVTKNPRRVAGTKAYLEGVVELQDAASQAACIALPASKKVLDYCAGGGGKALAYAASHDAELFAFDASAARLKDLPERARRAGVKVSCLSHDQLEQKGPYDLVIVDAPCSGSGTWRRAPEGKWGLTPERLGSLVALQADILNKAAALVSSGGCLAYMTCSGLNAENEDQVSAFLMRNDQFSLDTQIRFLPGPDGDGFFYCHLTRR